MVDQLVAYPITSDRARLARVPSALSVKPVFAERLKQSREAVIVSGKPMTKAEFVRRLNSEAETTYNDGNVRGWEREVGAAMPSARIIPAIAIVLDVSTDYLLGLTDDPTPPPRSAARAAEELARVAEQGP